MLWNKQFTEDISSHARTADTDTTSPRQLSMDTGAVSGNVDSRIQICMDKRMLKIQNHE